MGDVAQVQFDLAEGLLLGQVGEPLGHAPQRDLGLGAQALKELLDALRARVGAGRRR